MCLSYPGLAGAAAAWACHRTWLRLREAIALGLTPAEANAVFCENPEWGATEVERTEAERCYTLDSNNDIEIDDRPQVKRSDDGVWVAAWVWVPRPSRTPHSHRTGTPPQHRPRVSTLHSASN